MASRAIIACGLLLIAGIPAMADITWTLNDVAFDNGNTVTGSFATNDAVTAVDSFSLAISGPATDADFVPAVMVDSYLPDTIGIANANWSAYVALYLAAPLTSAGGVVDIASGYDCPSGSTCGTLLLAGTPEVLGPRAVANYAADDVRLPEPSPIAFWAGVSIFLGPALRRRLIRVS
jgi:hypothetical protein